MGNGQLNITGEILFKKKLLWRKSSICKGIKRQCII